MAKSTKADLAKHPLACVFWDDAHGKGADEYSEEEIDKHVHCPAPIKTFGLLIRSDEKGVVLVGEMTGNPGQAEYTHYRVTSFIPRGMIVEEIILGIPKRPKVKAPKPSHTPSAPPSEPA